MSSFWTSQIAKLEKLQSLMYEQVRHDSVFVHDNFTLFCLLELHVVVIGENGEGHPSLVWKRAPNIVNQALAYTLLVLSNTL